MLNVVRVLLVCQQITTNNDDYLIYIYYLNYNLHVYGDNKKVKCNINVHVRPQHIEWLSQEQKDIPPLDTNIACANKYVMANSFWHRRRMKRLMR